MLEAVRLTEHLWDTRESEKRKKFLSGNSAMVGSTRELGAYAVRPPRGVRAPCSLGPCVPPPTVPRRGMRRGHSGRGLWRAHPEPSTRSSGGATPRRTSRTPVAFFFAPQSRRSGAKGREGGPQGHQGTPPYRTRGRGGLQVKNREHIRFGCGTAGVSGVGHTAGRT